MKNQLQYHVYLLLQYDIFLLRVKIWQQRLFDKNNAMLMLAAQLKQSMKRDVIALVATKVLRINMFINEKSGVS